MQTKPLPARIRATADVPRLDVLGIGHTVTVSAADTNGAYEIVEMGGAPGGMVPPHIHANEDETFYVMQGEVAFNVEGEEVLAGPGTTIHLPRGVRHGFRLAGDGPARMLLIIAPAGLEAMFRDLAALPAGPPDPEAVGAICAKYRISFA